MISQVDKGGRRSVGEYERNLLVDLEVHRGLEHPQRRPPHPQARKVFPHQPGTGNNQVRAGEAHALLPCGGAQKSRVRSDLRMEKRQVYRGKRRDLVDELVAELVRLLDQDMAAEGV